jgi:hypothetical protein
MFYLKAVSELFPVKGKTLTLIISRTIGAKNLTFYQKYRVIIPVGVWPLNVNILTVLEL